MQTEGAGRGQQLAWILKGRLVLAACIQGEQLRWMVSGMTWGTVEALKWMVEEMRLMVEKMVLMMSCSEKLKKNNK